MKRAASLLVALLGCGTPKADQKAPQPAPVPVVAPANNVTHTVRGGEVLDVAGASVAVTRVTYVNQPCPKDVQCIHSGVIKTVGFAVDRSGAHEEGFVTEGTSRVLLGVHIQVISVQEGPVAQVDLAPAP